MELRGKKDEQGESISKLQEKASVKEKMVEMQSFIEMTLRLFCF